MPDIKIDFGGGASGTAGTKKAANAEKPAETSVSGAASAVTGANPAPQVKTVPATVSGANTGSTSVQAPPQTAKQGNADIFSKLASRTNAPIMVESIIAGKAEVASKLKPILGNPLEVQRQLEQQKEYLKKKKLRRTQTTFTVAIALSVLVFLYFYSQLSTSFNFFGPNAMTKLSDINKNLIGLQTKINKYRYLAAQQDLNQLSILADQFFGGTTGIADPNTSSSLRTKLAASVSEAKTLMPVVLARIKTNLGQDITVKTLPGDNEQQLTDDELILQFESELRTALSEEKTQITQTGAAQENIREIKLIDNATKIVGNMPLLNAIKGVSIDGFKKNLDDFATASTAEKRKPIQDLFTTIFATTNSDIATIRAIKNARVDWSTIISQIETITVGTDPNFGQGHYNELGGIIYNGYEFDKQSNKIVISGNTKTFNATNFTLISNLIDDIKESPNFENVDMRSFSKSGSSETGYTESFKIGFDLETNDLSIDNKPISLNRNLIYSRIKLKRISATAKNTAKK